jgi:protein gp37
LIDHKILEQPLHWKKPKRIFVENQSDLFGEWVDKELILQVWDLMQRAQQSGHTFQVLTKRPDRMLELLGDCKIPVYNIWLGISCEDQKTADERIPLLLRTPAAVRFVSYEPALDEVDLYQYLGGNRDPIGEVYKSRGLNWVIVGAESGHNARPFQVFWAERIITQCRNAGVPCFVKQLGHRPLTGMAKFEGHELGRLIIKDRKGGAIEQWPEHLRVREFPV